MSGYILKFSEITKVDITKAGGKGANLGEMIQAGMAVPDGFVLTADAYRKFTEDNESELQISASLKEAGQDEKKLLACAAQLREKIMTCKLPEEIKREVEEAYVAMGENTRAAVRSSATAEDLPEASFAGQQETYLNVRGSENIMDAVRKCYASLWGDRAVLYRLRQGYNQSEVALAVVVQQMVESEKAGVLFTVNPVNRDHNEMMINASYGLGESVVSGKVTPDTYICSRDGSVRNIQIGTKKTEIVYDGIGTKEISVSAERRAIASLSREEAAALCLEGDRIEKHYGCPMDIEWGASGGRVYILQARAITTLKEEKYDEALLNAYVNKNPLTGMLKKNMAFLLEKLSAPMYPLDEQFVGAINNQKSVIFSEIGLEMSMQPEMDDDGITYLPKAGKRITGKIIHFPAVLRELKDTEGCRRKTAELMKAHQKELEKIASLNFTQLDARACGKEIENCVNFVRRLAYDRFKYAMFSSFFCGKQYKKAMKAGKFHFVEDDLYSNLDYRTAVVSRRLNEIADEIRKNPQAADAIRKGAGYEAFLSQYPAYQSLLENFLAEHGMKSDFNCYCVYAKAFLEDPDRVIQILRPLLDHPVAEEQDKFSSIMAQLEAVTSSKKLEALRQDVDTLRYFHVQREESQYLWETAFYYMKKILARCAELLCGDSNFRENIAFLYLPELLAACRRGTMDAADREKIARRKANRPLAYAVWDRCKLKAYDGPSDILKGVGGSDGLAVGKVCVIRGPEEFYKMEKGGILVCPFTDPEWTPLFSLAAGVVADAGGPLSHAAIVAREYGIPAVLGVGHATSMFRDGDIVRVDGQKGEAAKVE